LSGQSESAKYFRGIAGLQALANFCRKELKAVSGDVTGCVIRGRCVFAFGKLRLQCLPGKEPAETNFAAKLLWGDQQVTSVEIRITWPFPPDIDPHSTYRN
jgi:hypothetical protein